MAPRQPPEQRILALFPGHGSQWPGMGADLLASSAPFAAAIKYCDAWVEPALGWSVREELAANREQSRLDDIVVLQLTLFSIEVALSAAWRERGVEPGAVLGTSLGELAAAYVAGALSLTDALTIVRARAELVAELRPAGGAVVVNVSEADALSLLDELPGEASISGLNGPETTAFSGSPAAMETLLERAEARGLYARAIRVEYPAHCALLDPVAGPLRDRIATIEPRKSRIPFYSTVRRAVVPGESLDPDYWVANLLEPVGASPTIQSALRDGWTILLETTPHPIFRKPVEDDIAAVGANAVHCATLRRDTPSAECLEATLARLAERGWCASRDPQTEGV